MAGMEQSNQWLQIVKQKLVNTVALVKLQTSLARRAGRESSIGIGTPYEACQPVL